MKEVKVVLSPEAKEVYSFLSKESDKSKIERSILNSLSKKVELIKSDPHYGDPVAKKLIPREYHDKYGVTNLFRVELPNFWRMLYTLTNDDSEIRIIGFILDIMNHKRYNEKFGYSR